MIKYSACVLRAKRSPFVKAYLEGVPKPEKIFQRIAGTDLSSSTGIEFFTTAPRFIDAKREQRVSKLFFHHVLYPGSGARAPLQPVVVRGSRGIRHTIYRVSTNSPLENQQDFKDNDPDPLRAPLHDNKAPILFSGDTEEALWASADPASPSFFYSPRDPKRGVYEQYQSRCSMRWNKEEVGCGIKSPPRWRSPSSSFARPRDYVNSCPTAHPTSSQVSCDTSLALLAGMLENYLRKGSDRPSSSSDPSDSLHQFIARVESLIPKPSGGYRCFSVSPNSNFPFEEIGGREGHNRETLIEGLTHTLLALQKTSAAGKPSSVYLPLHLPEEAVIKVRIPHPRGDRDSQVDQVGERKGCPSVCDANVDEIEMCRLAGGCEPFIPFAVGFPLLHQKAEQEKDESSLNSKALFNHIQFLVRVSASDELTIISGKEESVVNRGAENTGSVRDMKETALSLPHEFSPLSLGDSSERKSTRSIPHLHKRIQSSLLGNPLDPVVPIRCFARIERSTTPPSFFSSPTPSNRTLSLESPRIPLISRDDAETYFIPQRPLYLTIVVPHSAEKMCEELNAFRLRKQVSLQQQRLSGSSSVCFTSGRLTSSKKALHQHRVASTVNESSLRTRTKHLTYSVKAVPGDVVYIPRGWGLNVRRVLGTALVSDTGGEIVSERILASALTNPTAKPNTGEKLKEKGDLSSKQSCFSYNVEVDGFFVFYKPYPILTTEQSSVYLAANYVHGGIEDFYQKGGNNVFHHYE